MNNIHGEKEAIQDRRQALLVTLLGQAIFAKLKTLASLTANIRPDNGVPHGALQTTNYQDTGFSNWKDATIAFTGHEKSSTHKIAVEMVITLPKTTRDVGELISSVHAAEKHKN